MVIASRMMNYELTRRTSSVNNPDLKPFLQKYPPAGSVTSTNTEDGVCFSWKTDDGLDVNLDLSKTDSGSSASIRVELATDPANKELMMQLVSVGHATSDVKIKDIIASILSEISHA